MRNLITAQEVIDLAFAENSNMMAESISDTAIRIAEIKYIRPAFGVMYPLLADKYADFTNDYVKPALAYFVKCEIVSSIAIDMSNSGVAVANPQYQSAATDKQRQRLYDSEMSKAKTLLDFALEYIATHSEGFPDFSGEAPKKHHRVGGILLGGGTSRSQSASIAGEAFKNEFERLSKEVANKVDKVEGKGLSTNDYTDEDKAKVENIGDNTIIVDYDRIAELKASEEGEDVTHPEIAELVEKIYNEQEKLILVRHFWEPYEQLHPTYFVPDTNYGADEFGNVIITLYASYTPNYNTYGEQRLINLEISITQTGAILRVEQKQVTLLNDESVIDNLNNSFSKKPLSAKQGVMLNRNKVGYAEYDSESKAIMLYSDNTKKYQLGEIPIDSLVEEGYYPKMTVGMADNLVGRGDVQDAQINFRPSAGADNITDGAARIERIKGNSVVYNQLVKNADFRNGTEGWSTSNGTLSANNGAFKFISSGNSACFYRYFENYIPSNHKVLVMVDCQRASSDTSTFGIYLHRAGASNSDAYISNSFASNSRNTLCAFMTTTAPIERVLIYPTMNVGAGYETSIYSVSVIDLTQMFGAGNEPTTYEEYLQRKPMNIEDEFAYNEGELIDMKVDSLISTSDNAYDYTKEYARVMGEHTYDCSYGTAFVEKVYFSTDKDNIVAEENAMTSENGKYTFPSDGYAVPYTADGDVREYCVCLNHSYTKPHPPYQQEVKDLSFISEAFPKGMRSAGSVFDEIRFNKTTKKWEKVTRVGVVDLDEVVFKSYGSGVFYGEIKNAKLFFEGLCNRYIETSLTLSLLQDKQYTSLAGAGTSIWIKDLSYQEVTSFQQSLQGVMLYYELAEPIVTEIGGSENWNLDYLVWDFGTEEAITSVPSEPFRADINYEPNAVDDLRWAVDEIRKLKAQIAQMGASVTDLTE